MTRKHLEENMGQSRGVTGMAAMRLGRTYIGIEPETTQFLSAMSMSCTKVASMTKCEKCGHSCPAQLPGVVLY